MMKHSTRKQGVLTAAILCALCQAGSTPGLAQPPDGNGVPIPDPIKIAPPPVPDMGNLPPGVKLSPPPPTRSAPDAATAPKKFPAVFVEAEDFQSLAPGANMGWSTVQNGGGNYMVDTIGFNHISGERLLHAAAESKDAQAKAIITIPASGIYRVWSRFEQPTNADNRFRVQVRQNGVTLGEAVMGEKDAPKYFYSQQPVAQADPSWGSEGLVEQSFLVGDLQAGPAEIVLTALDQSALPFAADRNVDFLFLTQDLNDSWRNNPRNRYYPVLDAALQAMPPRYYLRLTSPVAQTVSLNEHLNRMPWNVAEGKINLRAGAPSEWLPLSNQDVAHWTTLEISSSNPAGSTPGLNLRAELASAPDEKVILRAIDWQDAQSNLLQISLPPYPNKYPGEKVMTVEEQYQAIASYLQAHPSQVGREPQAALAWARAIPVWQKGRVGDAAAALYHEIGLRSFGEFPPASSAIQSAMDVARERFAAWHIAPTRSVAIGAYNLPPTAQNIVQVKAAAATSGVLPLLARFDYGDELLFAAWLNSIKPDEMSERFINWQRNHKSKIEYDMPNSRARTAASDPILYVDSLKFYEETAIAFTAGQAKAIPQQLGKDVLYGGSVGAHPFYYPPIATYIKWFRPDANGDYAANFGRHSEYFWQSGLPGPLINGFVAEHFLAGMRANPQASNIQYTMPHSPGNTDADFRRSAFTHLAHGARGLDFFGVGINSAWTESTIDFRDPARFAAIRDVNRAMATIEDILPVSRPVPSKVALILSDSTERWDFAGVSGDRATLNIWGGDYKKTRLAYHQERVGIYYALIHNSRPPDLLIEEDVQNGALKNYDVAYWVGDCVEPNTLKALESWVQNGGQLVATAGAFRFDEYHRDLPSGLKLLGLQSANLKEVNRFFRPQIEMPRLAPLDTIQTATGEMPALAITDEVTAAAENKVLATFKNGAPAIVGSTHGKGRVTFIAALPGVAYLWSAYQPKPGEKYLAPSRGPSSHLELENFDKAAGALIIEAAGNTPGLVDAHGARIDARMLQSPNGYAISLANYEADVTQPITLTIRPAPNLKHIKGISSANVGNLKLETGADGAVSVNYVPGYGDVLRIE